MNKQPMKTIMKKLEIYKYRIVIFALCVICICSTLFFYTQCENWLNSIFVKNPTANLQQCDMVIHFVDIGQGDCILVDLPDNKVMLVDAGPIEGKDKLLFYLNNFFDANTEKVIDYFVITHADQDHYGGASTVFDNFVVKNCYRPSVYTSSEALLFGFEDVMINNDESYVNTIESMNNSGCEVFYNIANENLFNLTNVNYTIRFLAPLEENYENSNDYSAVIQIEFANRKILLTGDAEENIETSLVSNYGDLLQSDILKVGHHGSKSSTSSNFLTKVNPSYAVLSVEKDNSYNLPNNEVIAKLQAFVGQNGIYRTDVNGNVIFGVNSNKLVDNKGEIVIKTTKAVNVEIKVYWWCAVVLLISISFCIVFFIPLKKDKR